MSEEDFGWSFKMKDAQKLEYLNRVIPLLSQLKGCLEKMQESYKGMFEAQLRLRDSLISAATETKKIADSYKRTRFLTTRRF
jgi:nitrate reductase assembly molybdenum cofactor insertion protein NarJ